MCKIDFIILLLVISQDNFSDFFLSAVSSLCVKILNGILGMDFSCHFGLISISSKVQNGMFIRINYFEKVRLSRFLLTGKHRSK